MAIKVMTSHPAALDKAIDVSCGMVYDIEDLLTRGPQQLDAYTTLVRILKDMKRGVPCRKSVNIHGVALCPPGMSPSEQCGQCTCQACWEVFIEEYLNRIKEKQKEKI